MVERVLACRAKYTPWDLVKAKVEEELMQSKLVRMSKRNELDPVQSMLGENDREFLFENVLLLLLLLLLLALQHC
jgi:hypothetical protein